MEPAKGFEPPTCGLRNRCSTPELRWLGLFGLYRKTDALGHLHIPHEADLTASSLGFGVPSLIGLSQQVDYLSDIPEFLQVLNCGDYLILLL